MEKLVRVQKTSSGQKIGYIESIQLSGKYLKEHGFEMGDFIKITVVKNRIVIEKTASTNILQIMGVKDAKMFATLEAL